MTIIKHPDMRPRQEEGCRGRWKQKGRGSYSGQEMCRRRWAPGVQPTGGREGLQEERCGEEHVPIKGQGALHVLARWWEEEEDDEEGGQVQPCSSGEAGRSGAALGGGDSVARPKCFPPVESGPRASASTRGARGRCVIVSGSGKFDHSSPVHVKGGGAGRISSPRRWFPA